ncbi:MAG: hypothetical protein VW442_02335 [Acidimicrobiaceae bacterium]|jgi:hypothetical protein
MTTPVSPITTSFSHFVKNLVIPQDATLSPLSGMSTFGHNDPPIQCDVSSEAANLRRQVHFFEGLHLRKLLHDCDSDMWSMPAADVWREHLLNNIRLVETHCDALRRAAHSLDVQAFSGIATGSTAW